jgi:hypothetical protein
LAASDVSAGAIFLGQFYTGAAFPYPPNDSAERREAIEFDQDGFADFRLERGFDHHPAFGDVHHSDRRALSRHDNDGFFNGTRISEVAAVVGSAPAVRQIEDAEQLSPTGAFGGIGRGAIFFRILGRRIHATRF